MKGKRKGMGNGRPFMAILVLAAVLAVPWSAGAQTCTFAHVGTIMKLLGDCTTSTTITIPNGVTLDGQWHTIHAVDPEGGFFSGGVLANGGAVANVRNVTVLGAFTSTNCGNGGTDRLRGVYIFNGQGNVTNSTFTGIHRGAGNNCADGNAIVVENGPFDGTGTNPVHDLIANNVVQDFQLYGIIVAGNEVANIVGNVVKTTFPAPAGGRFAVTVEDGATGSVTGNEVDGGFQASGPNVTGIFVTDSSHVLVSYNCVSGTNFGISLQSLCTAPALAPAAYNTVIGNNVTGSNTGVWLGAQNASFSVCNPELNNNLVFLNNLKDTGGLNGIFVGTLPNGLSFVPEANANALIGNDIDGYTTPILDQGTDTINERNRN
jgi:hypothetical protein